MTFLNIDINWYEKGYQGKDLNLVTSTGSHAYKTPGSSMGPNNKFIFELTEQDKKPVLNIPYLVVESKESQVVTLDIPKKGKKLDMNSEVEFNDSTMIITAVERIDSDGNAYGGLKIDFSYKNKDQNFIFKNAQFFRSNLLGMTESGGYYTVPDENEITTSLVFILDKGEDKELTLKIDRPQYYLLGNYNLDISD